MPLPNRVTPYGLPERHPARACLLMGNRGTIHDARREIVRHHVGRRWIACVLEFRGHHREPMPPGRWTALFFLDEAVAFSAGHRPCKYCRREDHARFMAAWNAGVGPARLVDDVDRPLHAERYARGKRLHAARAQDLPDGSFIEHDGRACLVLGERVLPFTAAGYETALARPDGDVVLLTPPSLVRVLAAGYTPLLHPSAARGRASLP